MKRMLLLSILVAVGCASKGELTEGEILAQEPFAVGRGAGGDLLSAMDEAEARSKLTLAREAYLRGEYETSLSLIRTTLAAGPPADIGLELRSLRFEAKRALLSRRVVVARARPVKDLVEMDVGIELDLRVRNVSPNPVTIPQSGSAGSGCVFELTVSREDWDIYGNVRTVSGRYLVPPEDDLVIPVGGDAAVRFELPAIPSEQRHFGFTSLRIGGTFRAAVILSGDQRYYAGVDLRETRVRVLPPGYEPIAEDPLGTIAKALDLGAREHLLLAVELSPPERRRGVIRRLVDHLEVATPAMATTVMACLRRLTGESFANRAEKWQAWWKEGGRNGQG